MKKLILIIIICWAAFASVAAQDNPWADRDQLTVREQEGEQIHLPQNYRLLELNVKQMETLLATAPERALGRIGKSQSIIAIPLPDGSFQQFRIQQAPAMHPDLARKFPEINSYEGQSIDGPAARIYFSKSQLGFQALILTDGQSAAHIRPVSRKDAVHHLSYYEEDQDFEEQLLGCSTEPSGSVLSGPSLGQRVMAGDCQLRTYRLAVPTTAEFTLASATLGDPTGVNNAMAAINAMVTTINGVFQSELAIQLQLVANNNLLIFTNSATDGFTDGNQNTMAGENQGIVDGIIGSGNYDVSHALGLSGSTTSSSGVSLGIGTVCNNASKAMGATVVSNVGLPGGITTLIMHELGHHFGADHTFNDSVQPICTNAGQLNAPTAFEPGSGSTIMSYDGTCGTANVQGFRDRYFHAISLQQIGNYVTVGGGSCPTPVAIPNGQPTVNAGGDFTIPVSTPFMLTATGSDPDGDPTTFCWEQMDNQIIVPHPPLPTAVNGPVFRTFLPVNSPTRFFPNLPAVLAGISPTWEVLPSVTRTMNFRVTIRDNVAANGCTDEDDMMINFDGTSGPFRVIRPAGADCLFAGESTVIDWDEAGTDQAPVSCANVDILLSLDGGATFPITLIANTPNDGAQSVTLPEVVTQQARIMVKCSDNIFFNVNPGDFIIDCVPFLTVTDNPASGIYKARDSLHTVGPVQVLTNARFYAGETILLQPGFHAVAGCDFQARIQPCDPCDLTPSMMMASTGEHQSDIVHILPAISREESFSTSESRRPEALKVFPNPFHESFVLEFELEQAGSVSIQLLDVTGRTLRVIYQAAQLPAGLHRMEVDGKGLSSGMYDCRLITGEGVEQARILKMNR